MHVASKQHGCHMMTFCCPSIKTQDVILFKRTYNLTLNVILTINLTLVLALKLNHFPHEKNHKRVYLRVDSREQHLYLSP